GVFVKEGDLLVELSSDAIRDRLENEMLSLESARSELITAENALEIRRSDNESAMRQAEVRLQLANLEKNKWVEGTDVETKRQLELDVKANGDELERLRERLERSERLFDQKFLSGDQLKQDRLAVTRAEAELVKAELRQQVYTDYERAMELTTLDNEITEAAAELERVRRANESELTSKEAAVTNARRRLAVRTQRVANLEEQLENTVVLAPTSGLVVYSTSLEDRRNDEALDVGTRIWPNREIIMLPNSSQMIASIKVHEAHVGRVSRGQSASVRVDALRGRMIEGTVDSVAVVAESGGWRDPNLREYTVNILLDVDNPQEMGIKPSMRCEATIALDNVTDAINVPVQAVFFEDRATVVYTKHPSGKFERTNVRLGRKSDQQVEILAGLSVGDDVLLREPNPNEVMQTAEATDTADARITADTQANAR
ncbi:MAG: hypothetical protein AAGH64_06985, partial [Planctomycetota bacterium]